MEHITEKLLYHIAELSKLELPKEDLDKTGKAFEDMLLCVEKMNELDTDSVQLTMTKTYDENVLREDFVTNKDGRAEALMTAPVCENGMFVVPRTIG